MAGPFPFVVTLEFRINRRISWDVDPDELRLHLAAVTGKLDDDERIEQWDVRADLEQASLELDVVIEAGSQPEADGVAREAIGEAIRASGAHHDGLLPLQIEAQLKADVNAWWGLRTPKWQHRRAETTRA